VVNPEEEAEVGGHAVTVVVPTYDEAQNLPLLVEALDPLGVRLLVVDDASPDGTGEVADDLARSRPHMSVLHRGGKDGLGRAYGDGFRCALGGAAPTVVQMDADLSHDPADIPRLLAAIDRGADVVIGSRYVPGGSTPEWPWPRRFLSRTGNAYARWALGLPIADATGGYRAFRSGALARLEPSSCRAAGYGFQVEMAWRAVDRGLVVREIPIAFHDRRHGRSKMGLAVVLEAMWLVTRWGVVRFARQLLGRPTSSASAPEDAQHPGLR
jgi:dolichol-phosphate mannosyltransferase